MYNQEQPEPSQDQPLELFEPLTIKKIPASTPKVKEEAGSTPPAPPPSEVTLELQESVSLGEAYDSILPSQSSLEEVIKIYSLLTYQEMSQNEVVHQPLQKRSCLARS
jgi:hypothetical protein